MRDLLSFSPIDILVKSADQKSHHAILQELKDKEIYNMIIDIHDTENMSDFLKAVRLICSSIGFFVYSTDFLSQVLELQMNDFKYHYLFTSFDLETFEMEDFRYNFVNITAFRLVDTNDVFVKETLKEMEHFSRHHNVKFKRNLAVEVKVSLTRLSCYYDATFRSILFIISFYFFLLR